MKKIAIPKWIFILLILAMLVSIVAIGIAFKSYGVSLSRLGLSWGDLITLAGLLLALIAATATIYTIVISQDIHKFKSEIKSYKDDFERMDSLSEEVLRSQFVVLNDTLSSLEGDLSNTKYIKLARCRLVCGSPFSSVDEKLDCIPFIQVCSNSKDIELLKRIVDDLESKEKLTKDEQKLKNVTEEAIKAINEKMNLQKIKK